MEGWAALALGAFLAVAGFVGDVAISAIKRDLGIKDSGALIPGHGGILDRLDSLTYTAPLFFHIIRFFYY
jgi:phosphatidate cytidylyltransferase